MSNIEHVHQLMTEIGPLLSLYEVRESTEAPSWTLAWNDGTVVSADYDSEDHRITITADAGAMPAERKLETAEFLLSYNYLWHETGGVRAGVSDGRVLLIYDFFAVDLDLPRLSTILTNFTDKVRAFGELLTSQSEVTPQPESLNDLARIGIRA